MYYSNCLIEMIKAKIKNPKAELYIIKPKDNVVRTPHFMWAIDEKAYDFGVNRYLKPYERLWFKGEIRSYNINALIRFKAIKLCSKEATS
jgi:hypothetical protein